jgi:hypothetical protein
VVVNRVVHVRILIIVTPVEKGYVLCGIFFQNQLTTDLGNRGSKHNQNAVCFSVPVTTFSFRCVLSGNGRERSWEESEG